MRYYIAAHITAWTDQPVPLDKWLYAIVSGDSLTAALGAWKALPQISAIPETQITQVRISPFDRFSPESKHPA